MNVKTFDDREGGMLQEAEEFFAPGGDEGQQSVEVGTIRRFTVGRAQGERQEIQHRNDHQRACSADNMLRPPFQYPCSYPFQSNHLYQLNNPIISIF